MNTDKWNDKFRELHELVPVPPVTKLDKRIKRILENSYYGMAADAIAKEKGNMSKQITYWKREILTYGDLYAYQPTIGGLLDYLAHIHINSWDELKPVMIETYIDELTYPTRLRTKYDDVKYLGILSKLFDNTIPSLLQHTKSDKITNVSLNICDVNKPNKNRTKYSPEFMSKALEDFAHKHNIPIKKGI